jgi:hypothetical protein
MWCHVEGRGGEGRGGGPNEDASGLLSTYIILDVNESRASGGRGAEASSCVRPTLDS